MPGMKTTFDPGPPSSHLGSPVFNRSFAFGHVFVHNVAFIGASESRRKG